MTKKETNPKMIVKIAVDIAMTAALILLMSYELLGEVAHEWVGVGMFVLFVTHHILNRQWSRSIFHGKYTAYRAVQTALVVLILFAMLGSTVSGIMLSRHVFSLLPPSGGFAVAQTLHLLCGYWGFALMSLHLGFHWSIMLGMAKRVQGKPSRARTVIARVAALAVVLYGAYAFVYRNIADYLFYKTQFGFFAPNESLFWFLLDYAAIMGLFAVVGYYLSIVLKKHPKH